MVVRPVMRPVVVAVFGRGVRGRTSGRGSTPSPAGVRGLPSGRHASRCPAERTPLGTGHKPSAGDDHQGRSPARLALSRPPAPAQPPPAQPDGACERPGPPAGARGCSAEARRPRLAATPASWARWAAAGRLVGRPSPHRSHAWYSVRLPAPQPLRSGVGADPRRQLHRLHAACRSRRNTLAAATPRRSAGPTPSGRTPPAASPAWRAAAGGLEPAHPLPQPVRRPGRLLVLADPRGLDLECPRYPDGMSARTLIAQGSIPPSKVSVRT
jgi:hypothetical protein